MSQTYPLRAKEMYQELKVFLQIERELFYTLARIKAIIYTTYYV